MQSELITAARPPTTAHGRRNLETIRAIVEQVKLTETGYELNGKEGQGKGFRNKGTASVVPTTPTLPAHVEALARDLYETFYKPFPPDVNFFYPPQSDKIRREVFLEELKKAHTSRWSWIAGWTLVGEENGKLRVEAPNYGPPRLVERSDFDGPDATGKGRFKWVRDSTTLQASYYHFFGEESVPAGSPRMCRFYWAVCPEGAVPFVRTLSSTLNGHGIPFQGKVMANPAQYTVADTGVLYLPEAALPALQAHLPQMHREILPYLNRPTPAFAKPLGHRLAFADDPATIESFGQHRCKLIAQALWEHRGKAKGETLAEALAWLERSGHPLDRFHLNPATQEDFEARLDRFANPLREEAA